MGRAFQYWDPRVMVFLIIPVRRLLVVVVVSILLCSDEVTALSGEGTRREWMRHSFATAGGCGIITGGAVVFGVPESSQAASPAEELPMFLRPWTKLAPLGPAEITNQQHPSTTAASKTIGLSLEDIADRLARDLTMGATGKGGYFLTGDLSTDLFRNNCTFVDPTNQVSSLSQYQNALRILFDPAQSQVQLLTTTGTPSLQVDPTKRQISGSIRSRGILQLPWHPRVASYESNITYSIDDDGLVYQQSQTWSKSAIQALQESFTPSIFPPIKSTLDRSVDEPAEVTQLFEFVNGRRPNEYSADEIDEMTRLMDNIADSKYTWNRDLLPGKWMLVYLKKGPDGGGIDRRIPFPDFPFNSNYQVFRKDSVTNIGELFGPLITVKVGGTLEERDRMSLQVPKPFVANITSGKLCFGNTNESSCIPLPISGEGLFNGVYLGKRLRIGQNINGGGARVVQIRVT